MTEPLAYVLAAYLLGSLSFAVIVSRVAGLPDPRSYGSGNPGATNVLRSGRKSAAALTLLGDAAKGWLAVFLAKQTGAPPETVLLVALAVFIGHLYPVFFRFKGGKGVATALGVLLGLAPGLGLAALATWLAVAALSRLSSLAALTTALLVPVYASLLALGQASIITLVALSALLVYRHKQNLVNLVNGREGRIGRKSEPR